MALRDLTADSVRAAVKEFDELGREKFLSLYGFGNAKSIYLQIGDNKYDSKAIAGVAHKFARPKEGILHSSTFTGGEASVARQLTKLGFAVVISDVRNPDWTRDELLLALDFYFRHRHSIPNKSSRLVIDLSRELNRLAKALNLGGGVTFRNANGVYMKLMNFRRFDPDYKAKGGVGLRRGSKADEDIWNEFHTDIVKLTAIAALIRAGVATEDLEWTANINYDDPETVDAPEGRVVTRIHRSRERNRKLVAEKKNAVLKNHQKLACEICEFDFERFYGPRGRGFAECHHVKPVSTLTPGQRTRLSDLAIVCANCHRMIHAKAPWLTMNEIREIVRNSARVK